MAKKEMITKREICDLYGITMPKLEYHLTKVATKRSPHVFPEGVLMGGKKHYSKAEVEMYAKAAWKKAEKQAPLKLIKPLTKAEIAKELEPGLNALFGAAAQKDAAFDEAREANDAVVRVLEEKMVKLEEDYARSSRFNMVLGAALVALLFVFIFEPWMLTRL